jgi:hypothetical protein
VEGQTQANHKLAGVRPKTKHESESENARRVQGSGSTGSIGSTEIKARTQGALRRSKPIRNGETEVVSCWKGLFTTTKMDHITEV